MPLSLLASCALNPGQKDRKLYPEISVRIIAPSYVHGEFLGRQMENLKRLPRNLGRKTGFKFAPATADHGLTSGLNIIYNIIESLAPSSMTQPLLQKIEAIDAAQHS